MAPLPRIPMALKRLADFTLSLFGLVVLAPLLAVIWVWVRVTMGSPVLFRQQRHGRHEKLFTMLKFRTMRDAVGPDGRELPDKERLTRTGELLRTTSLDELPGLWNVMKGHMSLVGPRPLLIRYTPWFTARERLRFEVRPGITGLAQINGRNLLNWDERLAMDVEYVERWSLFLDVGILARTVTKVFSREGAVADANQVMIDLDVEREARKRREDGGALGAAGNA